ncbi:T9SS type A sorting domain-containing protein [Pontibacter beigongshangensis]|uniref:T9SS type A sorting domain-containing protein n=1 Tax=Pontibacter beigongshangensis TaxID=2574733 RepID=UPI00164F9B10|nr:T9SS type A sorting domain-containing protein [Pontibacter beigongshangensis]
MAQGRAQSSETYHWRNVQINGGGFVTGIIYNQTEKDLLYARTDVGGAYRWNAATASWVPLLDHLNRTEENYTGVLSLATDPVDPDRLYLATGLYSQSWAGTAAILSSTDRGNTWTRSPLSIKLGGNEDGRSTGERLQVDPNRNSTLFLGTTTDGLWKSTNYGVTWAKVTSFPVSSMAPAAGGIAFVLFDKGSGTAGAATQTIYVGVLRKGGENLYRSTDAGATWAAVPNQITNLMPHQAALAADGTLYITYADGPGPNGVTAGAVRKLNTATGNWTTLALPAGQGGFAGLALDPQQPGTLMVSTLNRWWPRDEVYRSTDAGTTWRPLLETATYDHSAAPYAAASNPHWLADLAIDPFNSNKSWFVTGYGVFNSTNLAGANQQQPVNWVFQNKGLEETVPLKLISPPAGAHLLSALGDIDGFRHDNLDESPVAGRLAPRYGTNTWIDFAANLPAFMVRTHFQSEAHFGAFSTDGGTSWAPFASHPAGVTGGGNIAVTADGAAMVWAPAGVSSVYQSANRSASWAVPAGAGKANLKVAADRVNANKVYAYDAMAGQVLVSTNKGANFAAGTSGLPIVADWQLWASMVYPAPGVEGDIWLTNTVSGLYRSTNSGGSFAKVSNVQEATKVGFGKAAAGSTYPAVFIVGKVNNIVGFFRSDDAGATWLQLNDTQHQFGGINDITGDPRIFGRVYLATSGRGIVYGDIQHTTSLLADSLETDLNIAYWPNPFAQELHLQSSLAFNYKIVNLVGQLVEAGSCAGACEIGAALPPGIYLLTFTQKNHTRTVRIMKK